MFKIIRLVSLMLLMFVLIACAHVTSLPLEERQLQRVHEIDLSKNEIFDKSLEWMALSFNDSKSVIEVKDKENGKIIGKGIASLTRGLPGATVDIPCRFTMIIEIKDKKYRTTFANLIGMFGQYQNQIRELEYQAEIEEIKVKLISLDESLYKYLNKSKSNSNW